MAITADYIHDAYKDLPTFESAQRSLEERGAALTELGEVILKHGMESVVGVSLLHKHFDTRRDERMVRSLRPEGLTSSAQRNKKHFVPWNWRLYTIGETIAFVPVEFLDPSSFSLAAVEQSAAAKANPAFLRDYADVLKKRYLGDVFGLATRNIITELQADTSTHIVAERPSPIRDRASIFDIIPRSTDDSEDGVAFWTFMRDHNFQLVQNKSYTCSACKE